MSDQREKNDIELNTLKDRIDKLQNINNLLKDEADKSNERVA